MRVVFDTNVIVAASRSRRGASFKLLSLLPDERFQICLSTPVYLEYKDVLTRPEIKPAGLTDEQALGVARYLASLAHLQEVYFHWRPFLPDSKDDMVLELAAAAQAKFIVTFNLRDFRGCEQFGVTAIRPGAFLAEIGDNK